MKMIGLLFFGFCPLLLAAENVTLYVSPQGNNSQSGTNVDTPVQTLLHAAQLAQTIKDKPVTVVLRGGRYEISEPLRLGTEDSRTKDCPLVFTAYQNEKPVIVGARQIKGWQKQNANLWTTEIAEVRSGAWYFTQLFVNGQRRLRARTPNEGFYRVAGFPDGGREANYHKECRRFEYKPGDINPNWKNLNDIEVIVYHFWTDSHLPIESMDTEKHIVTFKHEAGKVFTDDFTADGARYIVENVYEALDTAGEWYLDRTTGILSYLAGPGEDLNSMEVVAPAATSLIDMEGRPEERRLIENIRFEGLELAYTHFALPAGNSNDAQGSSSVPAAIRLKGCRNITFDRCTVRDLGTFAFDIAEGCRRITLSRNRLTGLGGGGIRINGGDVNSPPLRRTGDNTISDNIIGPYGQIYPSAVGVLLMHTFGNTVSHNEIHHGWYTGISVGWEWGYQQSVSRDNIIEYNHIHHIGQGLLSDMGAIYTLGLSPGTVLRNNLIHDIDANQYGGWGIYNDEGSSHILIENNIVYNTKFAGYNIHYAKEITVRNNIFAFGRLQQLSRSRLEPHQSCCFENNILYYKEGKLLDNNWKDEPYEFYQSPMNAAAKLTQTFAMDWNVYFNPALPVEQADFNSQSFEQWRQSGKDVHSVYADPLFVDAEKFDFRLKDDSPALKLGFVPIDMTTVGPR
jgi:parallel beta-helix repeat protein